MQRLGRNHGKYHGETIDIQAVLHDIEAAAKEHSWSLEVFFERDGFRWLALGRETGPRVESQSPARTYLSAGIHGDEPAGPLAMLRLLRENRWPAGLDVTLCPCLNPSGFALNRRENDHGVDLNRDYRHGDSAEVAAHIRWLERQPTFDLAMCLHEDWEAHGFYVYELNPDRQPTLSTGMVSAVSALCPIDLSPVIEGREAKGGIINPNLDPAKRQLWPESFWLIQKKTRHSYTLEAPSDFPLTMRVDGLVAAVNAALEGFSVGG